MENNDEYKKLQEMFENSYNELLKKTNENAEEIAERIRKR